LEAYEARRGTLVRIRERHWKTEFAGMLGTIQHCWGQSEHAAVDILLEDRRSELFWLSDLEVAWVCPVSTDCLPLSYSTSSQFNFFVV
jgi:hypothetical protein